MNVEKPKAEKVAADRPAPAKPAPTDAIVDEWYRERIYNTCAMRDEDVVRVLLDAKEALKAKLSGD